MKKDWFPLTSYEFYAFLSAGVILIAAIDFSFGGRTLVNRTDWTVAAAVFWAVIAYMIGHVIAGWSAAIVEHLIGRRFFRAPASLQLGQSTPRRRERVLAIISASWEYRVFPEPLTRRILLKARNRLSLMDDDFLDAETVFQTAYPIVRSSAEISGRLDQFINVYGLTRNVSFTFFLASVALSIGAIVNDDRNEAWLAAAALLMSLAMFGRFMKYYSAYSREMLLCFGHICED